MSMIALGGRKDEAPCPHCGKPVAGPRRRSWVRPLWTGVVIVAVLMAVTFVFMVMAVTTTAKHEAATSTVRLMERSDFSSAIRGKRSDHVQEIVGRPSSTQVNGSRDYWYYDYKTYDAVSGKPDRTAQVVLEYGLVDQVNFR